MSIRPSVCPSVRLKLKIPVTTEPIGFYSAGYIPIDPVVVLSYFLGGWNTHNPPPPKKKISWEHIRPSTSSTLFFFNYLLGQSP